MNDEIWRIEATKDGKTSLLPRTFDSHAAAVRHGHYQMVYADFDQLVIVPPPGHLRGARQASGEHK